MESRYLDWLKKNRVKMFCREQTKPLGIHLLERFVFTKLDRCELPYVGKEADDRQADI